MHAKQGLGSARVPQQKFACRFGRTLYPWLSVPLPSCGLGSGEIIEKRIERRQPHVGGLRKAGLAGRGGREGWGLSPRRGNPASPGAPEPALAAPAASPPPLPAARGQSSAGKRLCWAFPSFLLISERGFLEKKGKEVVISPARASVGMAACSVLKAPRLIKWF